MVPLYTLVLATVGGLKALLARRAGRAEKKYAAAALAAEKAAKAVKPGNAASLDPLAAAKRQYELGQLVQARDALEARYHGWQARADKAARAQAKLRGLKGRLVPYLCGVVDVALVLVALHYLGLPHGLNGPQVREWAQSLAK